MQIQESDIVTLCRKFRSSGRQYMTEANALAGARDLIRLTATATTLEWAASELATVACIPLPEISDEIKTVPSLSEKIVDLPLDRDESTRGIAAIDVSRLFRAHMEPDPERAHYPERWAFFEGYDEDYARRRIASILAAAEVIRPQEAEERVSACRSARDLIKQGLSDDRELRLFEIARLDNRVTKFVQQPLFILAEPAALIRKWASIRHPDATGR